MTYLNKTLQSLAALRFSSHVSVVPRSFFPCFCASAFGLIFAKWLPQSWALPLHAVMLRERKQCFCFSPFCERKGFSRTVSRHILKSQPKLGLTFTAKLQGEVGKWRLLVSKCQEMVQTCEKGDCKWLWVCSQRRLLYKQNLFPVSGHSCINSLVQVATLKTLGIILDLSLSASTPTCRLVL